ncbi:ADP-ribosylation [Hypoxylon trugodes]|uniref:ADP-ribosylation n=1 Tax=Hypoxylon trugodes TaxID=326681 RepID=UPI00219F11FC|nr:ADP-ribosylation [Hypoxylon trugodes]KAI1386343.1 ADP-ribosylation [Hypoxylon trugodes]
MSDTSELGEDDLVELSLLRDFEIDELIQAGFLSEDEKLTTPLDNELIIQYDELDLHVTAGPSYPATTVTWKIDNHATSREVVDDLRAQLKQIVEESAATNNPEKWRRRGEECSFGVFEPAMVVLELAKKTASHLETWRHRKAEKTTAPKKKKKKSEEQSSYLPFETKMERPITTISDVVYQYLQETPQQICSRIPPYYRILHIEEVVRADLAQKFHEKQKEMRKKLRSQPTDVLRKYVPPYLHQTKRKEVMVDYAVKPRLTFHGTSRQVVPSIVRYGFLKPGGKNPGTNETHTIRCGATYGRGIYSSPNPDFSLSYTGDYCHATKPNEFFGIKLIVCATLMGVSANMTRNDNWREQSEPYPGADSHVANRDLEYIVFDTAQILPVYVIHIDWGQENAQHFLDLPKDPGHFIPSQTKTHPKLLKDVRWPYQIQAQKAAAFASAAKWFPYGYGPSTGSKFVVEEVGEVDEDEEEYGDYQALRGEEIKELTNYDFWSWVKVGVEMDMAAVGGDSANEYARQRHWNGPEVMGGGLIPEWDELRDPREEDGKGDDDNENVWEEDGDLGLDLLTL